MKAMYFKHNGVLVKDQGAIEVLRKSGIGARVLNPIITAAEGVATQEDSPLLLLDEEAFYLSQKGVLEVDLASGKGIATLEFLWSTFVARNANFPIKYKVFSFFKDKGYVVRTGINFGVDYCIYHTLPSLCHSEMCITVVDDTKSPSMSADSIVSEGTTNGGSEDLGQLNWRHVTTLTRVIPDVNKLCVICYVLPATDVTTTTISSTTITTDSIGQDDASSTRISPLDILADAVDDICVAESAIGLVAGVDNSNNNQAVGSSSPEPPLVSPYLSTLFPTHPTTSTTSTTPVAIDFSTHICLDALSVHPVTTLVRRLPALAETYQTIKMVQEAYHSASTAQKKRDIKAANLKLKGNHNYNTKDNNKKNNHQRKPHSSSTNHSTEPTSITTAAVTTDNTSEPTSTTYTINTPDQEAFLLTADPATLSGRQKRVAKYLLKTQTQQKETVLLPQSKQMKARRDHRENRSKTMSNKNQSLLDLMHGGESKRGGVDNTVNSSGNSGGSSGNNGISSVNNDSSGNCSSAMNDTIGAVRMEAIGDTVLSMTTDDSAPTGIKRKFADKVDTSHDSSFWSIAARLNPFATVSVTSSNGTDSNNDQLREPNITTDTVATTTSDATTNIANPSLYETGEADSESTLRRKRCRIKYEQSDGTATHEESNDGYMGRAVKHCIIL